MENKTKTDVATTQNAATKKIAETNLVPGAAAKVQELNTEKNTAQKIAEQKADFEKMRAFFKAKDKKLKTLETIEQAIDNLNSIAKDNAECEEPEQFFKDEAKNFILRIEAQKSDGYNRRDECFTLCSPKLINEIIGMLTQKLVAKSEILRSEIVA